MIPTREDLELYVSGNYDGDVAALERALTDDPAMAALLAEEAQFEMALRDAAAAATFCAACDDLVRADRCDTCGAAVRPGGYTIERVLVSNAHGRMYVAHDADGKQVALKELAFVQSPSAGAIAAFEREAKFLRALEHPAIPRFLASFEEGRGVHARYYLAQELVVGKALDQLDDHWYAEAEIVDVAKQVLEVLVYLQSLSPMVIHRDIKPANLVRRANGSIAVVDFGAAHVHGTTAGVTTVGTFGYMPIEQLAGIVDATTDLYALGASLLYLLTRQEPWRIAQHKIAVNVSAPLRAYLDKLTANDPRDRFASAKDALAALDKREELVVRKRPAKSWRRSAIYALAATAAMAAVGGAAYKVARSKQQAAPASGSKFSTLHASMPANVTADLVVDGMVIASEVRDGSRIPIAAGKHHVVLRARDGMTCDDMIPFAPDKTVTVECTFGKTPPAKASEPQLKLDKVVSWTIKDQRLDDVMTKIATTCGVSVVVPDTLNAKITVNLSNVPCDQALEVLLESNGLWYAYRADANIIRIAPRKELDAEAEARMERGRFSRVADDVLPPGQTVDVDMKDAPLHDALRLIAAAGGEGGVNIVIPEGIQGRVTIRLKKVPWDVAFQAILESHGLWYRYREKGKLIRVAPRKELDAEDAAAFERSRFTP